MVLKRAEPSCINTFPFPFIREQRGVKEGQSPSQEKIFPFPLIRARGRRG
jgi:hypothetical protein